MGWLSRVFSSEDTISKSVDGVYNGIDKAFFTDEEKSDASMKVLEFQLKFLEAGAGYNVARRVIAVAVTAQWSLWTLTFLLMTIAGVDTEPMQEVYVGLIATPFGLILSWYFATRLFGKNNNKE